MIYIFTGNGKGKTTGAIGMGIRAVGADKKVLMVQFLKSADASSESNTISQIENFELKSFGRKGFFLPEEELKSQPEKRKYFNPLSEKDSELANEGLRAAEETSSSGKYHLIILDEVTWAMKFNLIEKERVKSLLKKFGEEIDLVLTGRNCPEDIIEMGDLVTEMKEQQHYFNQGKKGRKGIEE